MEMTKNQTSPLLRQLQLPPSQHFFTELIFCLNYNSKLPLSSPVFLKHLPYIKIETDDPYPGLRPGHHHVASLHRRLLAAGDLALCAIVPTTVMHHMH